MYGVFGLDAQSALGSSVNFFFYDTIKILILLFLISAVMGIVNAYLPIDRLRKFVTERKLYGFQYLFAALFGAITPFCSCSSVPLFIGFVKSGILLGAIGGWVLGCLTNFVLNAISVLRYKNCRLNPKAMMLKKVMMRRVIGIFSGVVALFIILSGYLFKILIRCNKLRL